MESDGDNKFRLLVMLSVYSIIFSGTSFIRLYAGDKLRESFPCRYFIIALITFPFIINSLFCTVLLSFSLDEMKIFSLKEHFSVGEYFEAKVYMAFITIIGFPIIINEMKKLFLYTHKLECAVRRKQLR